MYLMPRKRTNIQRLAEVDQINKSSSSWGELSNLPWFITDSTVVVFLILNDRQYGYKRPC